MCVDLSLGFLFCSIDIYFADDMILYIENPKDSTRKLLELTNEYGKVAGYKIIVPLIYILFH